MANKRKGIRKPKAAAAQPPGDAEKRAKADLAQRWLKTIAKQRDKEKTWRTASVKVVDRYRDERETAHDSDTHFNMLWANTETLKPSIFSRMPIADVRRRHTQKDPVGRCAAEILERSLSYCIEQPDFEDVLDRCLEDYLLPGRGQSRVGYEPTIEKQQKRIQVEPLPDDGEDDTDEIVADESIRDTLARNMDDTAMSREPRYPNGTQFDAEGAFKTEEVEELIYQEVSVGYTPWDLFVFDPAPTWKKCKWVAFGTPMTLTDVKANPKYAHVANELTYNYSEQPEDDEQQEKRALFWDVYHKPSRTFMVFAEGYTDGPVYEQADPMALQDFFPCPEPIYSLRNNKDWCPKPEYLLYQDQALELDEVTERIRALTQALKYRGVYDQALQAESKLGELAKAGDNVFLPVSNFRSLSEKGGLKNIFDSLPLADIAKVIADLQVRQMELKQIIYEVTGISDIVRGASKASETLGAQKLKAQYGNLRISTRQNRFQRFIRDILRIKAEIIAEHFEPATLKLMTGIEVLPDIAYAKAEQAGELPAGAVSETTFMAACKVLKSDKLRGFKVSIETDSTVPVDREAEQEQRTAFVQGLAQFMQQAGPAVAQGMMPASVAREVLLFAVRGFKVGSELEDVLEQLGQGDSEEGMRGQLQQLQQQLQQMQEQLQAAGEEKQALEQQVEKASSKEQAANIKAQKDAERSDFIAQVDARIRERQAEQELAIDARNAQQDLSLKAQDAKLDQIIQAMAADGEERRTEKAAEQERALNVEKEPTDVMGELKAAGAVNTLMEGMKSSMDALGQVVEALKGIQEEAAKPVVKRGTAVLPSGTIQLEMVETRQ